jgi:hypothetical protein
LNRRCRDAGSQTGSGTSSGSDAAEGRTEGWVAIFPDEEPIVRRVGALLPVQNDAWAVQRRHMSLRTPERLSNDPKAKHVEVLAERRYPTRQELDTVSADRPIYLPRDGSDDAPRAVAAE